MPGQAAAKGLSALVAFHRVALLSRKGGCRAAVWRSWHSAFNAYIFASHCQLWPAFYSRSEVLDLYPTLLSAGVSNGRRVYARLAGKFWWAATRGSCHAWWPPPGRAAHRRACYKIRHIGSSCSALTRYLKVVHVQKATEEFVHPILRGPRQLVTFKRS